MNLMKLDPWKTFEDFPFFALAPRLITDFAVDVYEEKGKVIAEMNLPGMKQEDIEVTFQNGNLKVSAKRTEEKETKERDFYYKEIQRGAYERLIALPTEVKTDKIEAHYANGVLKVVMPLKELPKKEAVKVQVH